MKGSLRRVACVSFFILVHGGAALAQDARDEARTAYNAAAHASEAGDFATAARELARADELAPNPDVLALALDTVLKTNDAVLAMELADRADGRSPQLAPRAETVRAKFAARVGKVKVLCEDHFCEVTIRGRRLTDASTIWLGVGAYTASVRGKKDAVPFEVRASATTELRVSGSPAAPPPSASSAPAGQSSEAAPPTPTAHAGGLSPAWFWIGAGVTVAAGVATTASAFDTKQKYDHYATGSRTSSLRDDGVSAQTRTNVLLGATIVALAATAAVGLFATRWSDDPPRASMGADGFALRFE